MSLCLQNDEALQSSFDKSGPEGQRFVEAVLSQSTWGTAKFLRCILAPIFEFHNWLSGCPCERGVDGRCVRTPCNFAGLRAPQMAQRLAKCLNQLLEVRGRISVADGAALGRLEAERLVSVAAAWLTSKFQWVQ